MPRGFVRFLRRNTIALLALFIALSGTTFAAATVVLPANSVGAKQLKKNAVINKKIKANAVTGAKVKNNSLTGADVLESSLGTVPSATNANHATSADSATNATNATNATKLGGYAANELSRTAFATFNFPTTTAGQPVATLAITTAGPAKSLLRSTATGYASVNGGTYPCAPFYWISVDGSALDLASVSVATASATGEYFTISNQHVVSVSPGSHTVRLMFFGNNFGTCSTTTGVGRLVVQSLPFGATGSPPAAPSARPFGKNLGQTSVLRAH